MRLFVTAVTALVMVAVVFVSGPATAATEDETDLLVTSENPAAAGIQTLSAASGADLFGVGGGQANGGLINFDLSAHTGPNGDFGHVGVKVTSLSAQLVVSYKVDVTCVNVHGPPGPFNQPLDRGIIRGNVKNVTPMPNALGIEEGEVLMFGIVDGGKPSDADVPADTFFPFNSNPFPGFSCKLIFLVGQANNVTQGNVNIKVD